uniref:Sodefrin-like factor n=1 Tax=Acrobeloides nanus TaxID=290746 RepID=A0A914D4L3_9BILA
MLSIFIFVLASFYIRESVCANVNCYICNDGLYAYNLTGAPNCTGVASSQWKQQSCSTGLCYYQVQLARLPIPKYNFSDTTRDCYEKPNNDPGLLDGVIQFMNQTKDCLTTRYYIESQNKEVGQACQCICNTNNCNQPDFPCYKYVDKQASTTIQLNQAFMEKKMKKHMEMRAALFRK